LDKNAEQNTVVISSTLTLTDHLPLRHSVNFCPAVSSVIGHFFTDTRDTTLNMQVVAKSSQNPQIVTVVATSFSQVAANYRKLPQTVTKPMQASQFPQIPKKAQHFGPTSQDGRKIKSIKL